MTNYLALPYLTPLRKILSTRVHRIPNVKQHSDLILTPSLPSFACTNSHLQHLLTIASALCTCHGLSALLLILSGLVNPLVRLFNPVFCQSAFQTASDVLSADENLTRSYNQQSLQKPSAVCCRRHKQEEQDMWHNHTILADAYQAPRAPWAPTKSWGLLGNKVQVLQGADEKGEKLFIELNTIELSSIQHNSTQLRLSTRFCETPMTHELVHDKLQMQGHCLIWHHYANYSAQRCHRIPNVKQHWDLMLTPLSPSLLDHPINTWAICWPLHLHCAQAPVFLHYSYYVVWSARSISSSKPSCVGLHFRHRVASSL